MSDPIVLIAIYATVIVAVVLPGVAVWTVLLAAALIRRHVAAQTAPLWERIRRDERLCSADSGDISGLDGRLRKVEGVLLVDEIDSEWAAMTAIYDQVVAAVPLSRPATETVDGELVEVAG